MMFMMTWLKKLGKVNPIHFFSFFLFEIARKCFSENFEKVNFYPLNWSEDEKK